MQLTYIASSRDGLERLEVGDKATVRELKDQIAKKLDIPIDCIILSKEAGLVSFELSNTVLTCSRG